MTESSAAPLVDLIREVKNAIYQAQARPGGRAVRVTGIDLEVKTTMVKTAGVDGTFSWLPLPIAITGEYARSEVHTVSISLVPQQETLVPAGEVADELADAIEVIKASVEEAARSAPVFGLKQATVVLNLGATKDGKIAVIISGSASSDNVHTVTLSLSP